MKNIEWKLQLQPFKPYKQNVQTWLIFIYIKSGKRGLRPSHKQIQITQSQLYKILMSIKLTLESKCTLPRLKWYITNYNTTLCMRSKTHSKTSTKTIGANLSPGARLSSRSIADKVISSSLWIQPRFYSTQYLISKFQPQINTKHEVSQAKYYTTKHWSTQNYFNRVIKTTIHYYSLVLNREGAVQTTAIKRTDLERHRLLIKLDPASTVNNTYTF